MGFFIDDDRPALSFLFWLLIASTLILCIREIGVYGPAILDHAGAATALVVNGAIVNFSHLAAAVGTALAEGIVGALGVPIGVVSIVTIYRFSRKTGETRRAWLVAVGLFLYPIFVDFFKDELPPRLLAEGNLGIPGAKIAIAVMFATIFLVATMLYEKSNRWGKVVAGCLYLAPLFIMIGYLVRYENPADARSFFIHLSTMEWLGLTGLILTAVFGIYLSRTESIDG